MNNPRYPFLLLALVSLTCTAAWAQTATQPDKEQPNQSTIRFQFDGLSYDQIIRRFAQMADRPLISEHTVAGTITFFDAEAYTFDQALDTLNQILAPKGYTLIEDRRFLKLVPLKEIARQNIKVLKGLAHADSLRPGQIVTVVLPLKYLEAEAAAKAIQPMVSTFGTTTALASGKGVIITDRLDNIQRIRQLLADLDTTVIIDRKVKTISLEYASAKTIAGIIDDLFGKNAAGSGRAQFDRRRRRMVTTPDPKLIVTATFDERTNTVIITGTDEKLALAEQMIDQLDVNNQTGNGDIRVFTLKSAKAVDVAKTVQQVIPKQTVGSGKNAKAVTQAKVVGDPVTNRIIVSAPIDLMSSIQKTINELDTASSLISQTQTFNLKNANAENLVKIIASAVGRRDASGKLISKLAVAADKRSNTLVISGTPADVQAAGTLIKELEKSTDIKDVKPEEIHVVQLKSGDAKKIAPILKNLFKEQSDKRGKDAPKLKIEVDANTNSLIVASHPEDWQQISQLLDELKTDAESSTTRIIRLKHADARQLKNIIYQGTSRLDERKRRIHPIIVEADAATNCLIISGPEYDIQRAGTLVQQLDAPEADKTHRELHVVKLAAGDANKIAQSLNRLFREQTRGRTSSAADFRVEADYHSNSLIIACAPEDWQRVQELLKQLNANSADNADTLIRSYPLKSANASDLANTLNRIYGSRNWWRMNRKGKDPITISASRSGNSILVSAPTDDQQEIASLIQSMDRQTQQEVDPIIMVRLASTDAARLATRLRAMIPPAERSRVAIQPDETTNTVLIRAPEAQRTMLKQLIEKLDDATQKTARETKLIKLNNASASAVAATVRQVVDMGLHVSAHRSNWLATMANRVILSPAPDDRVLVIEAPRDQMERITQLINDLDNAATTEDEPIEMITLQSADASRIVGKIWQLLPADQHRVISIKADEVTNSVFLRAPAEHRQKIKALIEQIDKSTQKTVRVQKIIKLKNASANQMVRSLNSIYNNSYWANIHRRSMIAAVSERVFFSAGPDDATLIIEAPDNQIDQIIELTQSLDDESADQAITITTLRLKTADATKMAQKLQRMLPSNVRRSVAIQADELTNAILLRAPEKERQLLEKIVRDLDEASQAVIRQTRIIKLTNASARGVASTLNSLIGQSVQARAYRHGWASALADRIVITPGPDDRTLVIEAPQEKMQRIVDLAGELDASAAEDAQPIVIVKLQSADATRLAGRLRTMLPKNQQREVAIQADEVTNSILIRAPENQRRQLEQMIQQLDNATQTQARETRLIPLKFASAGAVAGTLNQMFGQSAWIKAYRRNWVASIAERIVITASPDDRTLVVEAPRDKMERIAELATQFDTASTADLDEIKIIPLIAADAGSVAAQLRAMLPPQSRGRRNSISIQADTLTNSILLRGPVAQRQMLEDMVARLDHSSQQHARITKLVKLKFASAQAIADTLMTLELETGARNRRRTQNNNPAERVVITPAPDDKTIVLEAPKEKIQALVELANTLDTKGAGEQRIIRTYDTGESNPAELAIALNRLYADNRRNRKNTGQPAPRFEPDMGTNQMLVSALPEQFKEIDQLIKTIKSGAQAVSQTQIFKLQYADAAEMVNVLQQMINQHTNTRSRGRRRSPISEQPVRIAAVDSTNAIVAQASPKDMALIRQIIDNFDNKQTSDHFRLQIVQLKNAQANSLAQAVTAVLNARAQSGNRRQSQPTSTRLTITAEPNSNSLLVRGSTDEVEQAIALIAKLDSESQSDDVQVHVFALKNARASELAKSMNLLFNNIIRAHSRAKRKTDSSAPVFSVAADNQTNSLIVSTSAIYLPLAQKIVDDIERSADQPDQQVQFIPLTNADAINVANKLRAMFRTRKINEQPEIFVDGTANALTVVGTNADIHQIETAVNEMDAVAAAHNIQVRAIAVGNVRAQALAQAVQGVISQVSDVQVIITDQLPPEARPAGEQDDINLILPSPLAIRRLMDSPEHAGRPTTQPATGISATTQPVTADKPRVWIAVDNRANTLIVSAPRRELALIEELAMELVANSDEQAAEIQTFKLKHGDPNTIAKAVTELFRQTVITRDRRNRTQVKQTSNVLVIPDTRTGSVIVRAQPMDLSTVKALIDQMDQGTTIISEVRIFPLRHTTAQQVAANLKEMFQLIEAGKSQPAPRNNNRRNRNTPQQTRAQALEQILEIRTATGIQRIDANTMVSVSANSHTNSVMVIAPAQAMTVIAGIIQELDQSAAATRTPVIRLYPVKQAQLQAVQQTLQQIFAAPKNNPRSKNTTDSDIHPPVIVTADPSADLLVVSASSEQQQLIAQLIADMDSAAGNQALTVKVYHVNHTQAAGIVDALNKTLAEQTGNRRNNNTNNAATRIAADRSGNTIIVRADADTQQRVAELIKQMDQRPNQSLPVNIIKLTQADANAVAASLNRIFGAENRRGRNATDQAIVIEPDTDAGMLIVRADADTFQQIQAMAQRLDQGATHNMQVHIIALKNGNATEMAQMVQELYQQQLKAARAAKRTTEPLAVTADTRANALVISASKSMYQRVADWVNTLEQMKPNRGSIRIITLEHADPQEVEQAIKTLFNTTAGNAGNRRRNRNANTNDDRVKTTVLNQQKAILLEAGDADYQTIAELVKALDRTAEQTRRQVKLFTLAHATNTRVAQALNNAFNAIVDKKNPQDRVRVIALPQTDAVVVTASTDRMTDVQHLIEQLDKPTVTREAQFKIYNLQHAVPSKILPILQKMVQQIALTRPGQPIQVNADDRTRTLIVTAPITLFDQIGKLIEQLDTPPAHATANVMIVRLRQADAQRLADVLNQMLKPADGNLVTPEARALQEQVRRLQLIDASAQLPALDLTQPIKITADPARAGANALLVNSTPENLKVLKVIIERLDTVPLAQGVHVELIHLRHADADTCRNILRDIFNQGKKLAGTPGTTAAGKAEPDTGEGKALVNPLNVSSDLRTNSLVIAGVKESVDLAKVIVADLDRREGNLATQIKVLPLKFADPERLAETLRAVFAEGAAQPQAEGIRTQVTRLQLLKAKSQPGPESRTPKAHPALSIQPDPTTQALVIAARSDLMPLILDVVKTMDIPAAAGLKQVRIFPLENASATRLQQMLNDLFAGNQAKLVNPADRPAITVDSRTNALVIAGNDKIFAMLTAIIRSLDTAQPIDLRNVQMIQLKQANASSLAPIIQKMTDARVQRQQSLGVKDAEALRVIVAADARTNSLIVGGEAEGIAMVKQLADQLDNATTLTRVFHLNKASAEQVAQSIRNLFAENRDGLPRINISVDQRTNALLVSASAPDMTRIEELISQLDTEKLTHITEIRVFPLANARAEEMATILNQALNSKPTALVPGKEHQQTLLQFATGIDGDRELIASALKEGVLIVPDQRTNALVVSAPVKAMPLLANLIKAMDESAPRMAEIRVFKLTNADATQMAQILTDLFHLTEQGKGRAVRYTQVDGKPIDLTRPGAATHGTDEQYALSVTVDQRTNSLLIGGTKHYMSLAGRIIEELDNSPRQQRMTHVYRLRNAQAQIIEQTIRKFLDQERQRLVQTLGNDRIGAAQRLLDHEVAIVAEPNTNTLLLSAGPRYFKTVAAMIEQLDKAPPQVLVQCVLAEIALDNNSEFGFQWEFDMNSQNLNASGPIGTVMGVPAFAKSSGLAMALTAGDFKLQLQALKTQGRLEVLSRPQILALDNQQAKIDIGDRVPIISNVRITDNDNVIRSIQYENVGVILEVTPRINPDGFVRMEIKPSISTYRTSEDVQITDDVDAVIINQRSAETTVTVQDGHTIILGGLIQTINGKTVKKVPLLGDIPGIGELFKSESVKRERKELLIILTPHVIFNQSDLSQITDRELKRRDLIMQTKPEQLEDGSIRKIDSLWPTGSAPIEPQPRPHAPHYIPIYPDAGVPERPQP